MKIIELAIDKIRPVPNQPRKYFNPDKIEELAKTIRTTGIINPIEVDEDYMIITGENRWRAAQVVGLKKTYVKVLTLSKDERFMRQVIENIQYANLTPHEIAEALKTLLLRLPGKRKKRWNDQGMHLLAEQLGKSVAWISQHLALLDASDEMQKAVKEGLEIRNLRAIRMAGDYQKQIEAKVLKGHFPSANAVEEVVQAINRNPDKAKQLLSKNYSKYKSGPEVGEVVALISPRLSDMIALGQKPLDQLTKIDNLLTEWLKNNSPKSIGSLRLPNVLLILSSIKDNINNWKN